MNVHNYQSPECNGSTVSLTSTNKIATKYTHDNLSSHLAIIRPECQWPLTCMGNIGLYQTTKNTIPFLCACSLWCTVQPPTPRSQILYIASCYGASIPQCPFPMLITKQETLGIPNTTIHEAHHTQMKSTWKWDNLTGRKRTRVYTVNDRRLKMDIILIC